MWAQRFLTLCRFWFWKTGCSFLREEEMLLIITCAPILPKEEVSVTSPKRVGVKACDMAVSLGCGHGYHHEMPHRRSLAQKGCNVCLNKKRKKKIQILIEIILIHMF